MGHYHLILIFVLLPFIGFLLSLLAPPKSELFISRIAIYTSAIQLIAVVVAAVLWIIIIRKPLHVEEWVLYQSNEYRFFIDFLYDANTIVFLLVGAFITFLIVRYSRYYMHLENGYKRFFNTILFFSFGYNWTIISGNFETFFMGWEILGISSFLLIAFYRNRYLPVKNAVKVFSIYRIGDLGILGAMWASHHLWHVNITFLKLQNLDLVHEHLAGHSEIGVFIGLMLLLAATVKSAQFPFSTWLPRAMEGPTPSSAIFYGSLYVHLGVYLLLRTFPFWESQPVVRIMIGCIGLVTAIISSMITKVQSSIKPQIAYASITQIGIIFIEIALGWHTLALLHFAGNAFLRTYQLLVSPSVVSYFIRDQFYHFVSPKVKKQNKLSNTLYLLSIKEWNMDYFITNVFFKSLKDLGKILSFLNPKNVLYLFIPIYIAGLVAYLFRDEIPVEIVQVLPEIFALIGCMMVLKAFAERNHPRLVWLLVILNHVSLALSVSFNEYFEIVETFIYLAGVFISGILGWFCLFRLKKLAPAFFNLNYYHGLSVQYPVLHHLFFLAMLGMTGFPITTAFIGEDLLFSHIFQNQYLLAFVVAVSFVVAGIALIRLYARLFLGPYPLPDKSNHLPSA